MILGNTQTQAPVAAADVRVGRDRRQFLSELDPYSPFLYNNKPFTDTDGERALVLAFNHRFQNC